MPLRKTLLLATVLVLGTSAAMAQGIDNNSSKLSAGASGSGAGLISGGGKVYSNLEAIENSARPKEAIPETRKVSKKVSKKYASADNGESRRTKAKKKQKIAKKEVRYNKEVRYMRRSGFTAFIVPDYPRY
jgi:hypothetical protein